MSIYAVVKIEKPFDDFHCIHIYSKQTSNLDVIKAYREELANRHPEADVRIMTRESAEKLSKMLYAKMKEIIAAREAKLNEDNNKRVIANWRRSKDTNSTFISACGRGSWRGAMEAYAEYKTCQEW